MLDHAPPKSLDFARLAMGAYEPETAWLVAREAGFSTCAHMAYGGTFGIAVSNDESLVIVFRGTDAPDLLSMLRGRNACGLWESLRDTIRDLWDNARGWQVAGPFAAHDRVHHGFQEYADRAWPAVREAVRSAIDRDTPVYLCGHSLGAAAAALTAARIVGEFGIRPAGVYLFGCPRIGNREFAALYDYLVSTVRYRNNNDCVCRVPGPWRYRHVGLLVHFSANGDAWKNPGALRVLWDRWRGRVGGLFRWGTDGIADHAMSEYLRLVKREADA